MAPPMHVFHASELPLQAQVTSSGKLRKPNLDLEQCPLMEMVQHKCNVRAEKGEKPVIVCLPVVRLFRKCADGLTVETTVWEKIKNSS